VGKKSLAMDGSAIAFVGDPVVVGKLGVEFLHELIAGDFGENGGGGDGVTEAVTFGNGVYG